MDVIEIVKLVFMAANMLLTVAVWFATRSSDKEKATVESINRVEETLKNEIKNTNTRVSSLERDAGRLITHEESKYIYKRLDTIDKEISEVGGEVKQMSLTLNRINEWILNR